MKDFTYINTNHYNLFSESYEWLMYMGLRETLWILDVNWIIRQLNITYSEWLSADKL